MGWYGGQSGGGGGMSIGGAIGSGTPPSVLWIDTGGVLAQDAGNFTWDKTNKILLGGKQLNLLVNAVSKPALFPVYNASGDNWFIGEAGNLTLTGNKNTGAGATAGTALTSGSGNALFGYGAGSSITTGSNNTLVGNWTGIAALASVIALSDGVGNLLLDYNYTTANAWSIQNGTNGQVVSIYNTLSGSNYEKLSVDWTALGTNTPLIWTQKGGTGTDRQIWFQSRYSGDTLRLQFGDNSPNGAFGSGCGLTSDSPNVTKLWVRSDNGNNNAGNTGAASLQFLNTARDSIEFVIYDRSTAGTAYGFSIAGRGFLKAVPQTDLILANGSNGIVAIVANAAEVARFSPDKTFGQATQTVASLPAAGTAGRRAFVTDANATTFASIVAGGGANKISVYDDGTNWRIG